MSQFVDLALNILLITPRTKDPFCGSQEKMDRTKDLDSTLSYTPHGPVVPVSPHDDQEKVDRSGDLGQTCLSSVRSFCLDFQHHLQHLALEASLTRSSRLMHTAAARKKKAPPQPSP